MRHPRPYQYEIVIPIKLRIPVYIEPVVIDASGFSASNTDALNTDPSAQINAHACQTPISGSALTSSSLNVQIQPELVEQELAITCQSQSAYLTRSVTRAGINFDLEQEFYLPKPSKALTRSRFISLLATASILAATGQVLSWTLGQICPSVSHDFLLQTGIKVGHSGPLCSVPTDESGMEIKPTS